MIVRQNPWEALLPQMLMLKFQHGLDMEITDKKLKAAELVLKEGRDYKEGQDRKARQGVLAQKGYIPTQSGEEGAIEMPVAGGFYKRDLPQVDKSKYDVVNVGGGNVKVFKKPAPTEMQLIQTEMAGGPEGEKAGEALRRSQERKIQIAQQGRLPLGSVPTSTPGIIYDRLNKKFLKRDDSGNEIELTSKEVQDQALKYREALPTNDIRVMQQSVPSVKHLLGEVRKSLNTVKTGPLMGRWKNVTVDKVGMNDPDWRRLRTNIDLLGTRLMKMHVGAQGGEYIMKHFDNLLTKGRTSQENMIAVLDGIEDYANSIIGHKFGGGETTSKPPTAPKARPPKVGTIDGGYIFNGGDYNDPKNWKKVR